MPVDRLCMEGSIEAGNSHASAESPSDDHAKHTDAHQQDHFSEDRDEVAMRHACAKCTCFSSRPLSRDLMKHGSCSTASEDATAPTSASKTETYAVEGIDHAPRGSEPVDFVEDSMSEGIPPQCLYSPPNPYQPPRSACCRWFHVS